jgi:hypothetical protein
VGIKASWEKLLLTFMGPPQLGDVNAPLPDTPLPDPVCPRCGWRRSEHEVVRDPGLTHTRCPAPAP